ncbi:MAG: sugar-binding transcriptional regulator [Eubacteriaceae bacterium]|nr:sugar-binding transcriptional regulator [Eubacteriaceae bacterium]
MTDWNKDRILMRIASMYYIENLTQSEISKELGIYRTTISRLLKTAREEGIVNISISSDAKEYFDLEKRLEKTFSLKEVVVVPCETNENDAMMKKTLGRACAEYLIRIIKNSDVVGFTWGSTLAEVGEALLKMSNIKHVSADIVPITGGPGNVSNDYQVNTIVSKIAKAFNATPHNFYAPSVTSKKETRDAILGDDSCKAVTKFWDTVNIALFSIGAISRSNTFLSSGYFQDDDIDRLKELGAESNICSKFLDKNGAIIDVEINDRSIEMDINRLKNIEYSIGVSASDEKVPAILSALRGGFINVLITTEKTAKLLLELQG